jgi:DNA repair exonuclease SbcCD ATPase subunit
MTRIAHISDLHWRGIARHKEYKAAFDLLYKELRRHGPEIIINTGDTFHTKTQGITPEVVKELADMFNELADIAPSYTLLGNHDGNLTNASRMDILSPIHQLINNPNAILLKKSGTYRLDGFKQKIALHAFSVFDQKSWGEIKPLKGYINIALYHGSITGCQMDNNWRLPTGEQNATFFREFDFVMLGDIHKHQYLGTRKDETGVEKPWIAYPGSLIQQNFGEDIKKGYLVWDIDSPKKWDVNWHHLVNMAPFVTLPWLGTVDKTIEKYASLHGKYAFMPGSRYRITSSMIIPQIQSRKLVQELTEDHDAFEVSFKTDIVSRMDSINAGGVKISKRSLAQDPDAIIRLYKDYINKHLEAYQFSDDLMDEAQDAIKGYLQKLIKNTENAVARNVTWSIKDFKFDNLFGYGENNQISFSKLNNVVGIFGPNRTGKSSIIGGIMYTLFNTSDRGSLKNNHIINRLKNKCRGEIRFSVGTTDYIVERSSDRIVKKGAESSTTTVNLWRIRNDGCQEVKVSENGISRDDTDAKIRKLIGTADDFLLTAFASQGNLNRFIDNKATKRKEILNRFLELDIFDKLFTFAKEDYSKLNNQNERYSLEEWQRNIQRTEKDIVKAEVEVEALKTRQEALNEKRDKLNIWVKSHEQSAAEVEVASFENLKKHIDGVQKSVDNITERLKTNKVDLRKAHTQNKLFERKLAKIDLDALRSNGEAAKRLQENMAKLKASFDLETAELKTQERAVVKLKLVPCGKQFPDCHFIKDGHEAKKTVQAQKELVKAVTKDFSDNQKIMKKYAAQRIGEKIQEHGRLTRDINLTNVSIMHRVEGIKNDEHHLISLKKDLRASKAKLKKAEKTVNRLGTDEFKKKQELLSKTEESLQECVNTKNRALIELGGKQQQLQKLKTEETEGKDLINRLKLYESIQSAFSKNGIPAMVLMTQLPAINREMAKILGNLVDFTVTLETDITSNIMDVYIEDGKSRRLVELGSGMEKTVCSLALRVALGNLTSLARPDIFVLDESFGALDEDSLQKGMELLGLFRGYFKAIFVITHVTPIKEAVDSIIEIKHNGLESSITV